MKTIVLFLILGSVALADPVIDELTALRLEVVALREDVSALRSVADSVSSVGWSSMAKGWAVFTPMFAFWLLARVVVRGTQAGGDL